MTSPSETSLRPPPQPQSWIIYKNSFSSKIFEISLPGGVIWCEKYLLKINGSTSSALRSTCQTCRRFSVLTWKSRLTSKFSFHHLNMKVGLTEKYWEAHSVNVQSTYPRWMFKPKGKGAIGGDYIMQGEGAYSNSSSQTKLTIWI